MSPMFSSCTPARYGYQSARAGSQRWTWASTTRSTVMLAPRSSIVHDAAQGAVDPRRQLGSAEGDGRSGVRVAAEADPLCGRDQLRARHRCGVVGADQVADELADARVALVGVGLHADGERVGADVGHEVRGA